jgi:hypothetical protein
LDLRSVLVVTGLLTLPVAYETAASPLTAAVPQISPALAGGSTENIYYYHGRYYPYYYRHGRWYYY